MGLIHEMLMNLRTDLHIIAYSTNNLLWSQEHVKLFGKLRSDRKCVVDHKYQTKN